jgi:hypothetical protein
VGLAENDWFFTFEDDVNVATVPGHEPVSETPARRHQRRMALMKELAEAESQEAEEVLLRTIGDQLSLPAYNYTRAILEVMLDPQVRDEHGLFYLGQCQPTRLPGAREIVHPGGAISRRGSAFCIHALAYTRQRAATLFNDIAQMAPTLARWGLGNGGPLAADGWGCMDRLMEGWSILSGVFPYALGISVQPFPQSEDGQLTEQWGFVYQDRHVHRSTIW